MTPTPNKISIIVPALNEAENLPALAERITAALAGCDIEILIVDDNSRDNTPAVCAELSKKFPLKLLVRTTPKDGLGGAVLHGIAQASGEYLVVMDADLQHPPEKLPELLAPLEKNEADFTLGSRHVAGGSVGEKWGAVRKLNSYVATMLARPFAGRTLDPMSGFFGLRRTTFDAAQRLTPLGYKIGLELMCKCRVQRVKEIPIHFALRTAGESKLTIREQFRYLEHLSRLYDFCFPRLSPISKFLIVTSLSWIVGLAVFAIGLRSSNRPVMWMTIAYAAGIAATALFHQRYIRTQREFLVTKWPWGEFLVIAAAELSVCALVSWWQWERVIALRAWEMFVLSFGAATFTRYVLRKELMHDIRGLRREMRVEEIGLRTAD